jgi:hypothetical protein
MGKLRGFYKAKGISYRFKLWIFLFKIMNVASAVVRNTCLPCEIYIFDPFYWIISMNMKSRARHRRVTFQNFIQRSNCDIRFPCMNFQVPNICVGVSWLAITCVWLVNMVQSSLMRSVRAESEDRQAGTKPVQRIGRILIIIRVMCTVFRIYEILEGCTGLDHIKNVHIIKRNWKHKQ